LIAIFMVYAMLLYFPMDASVRLIIGLLLLPLMLWLGIRMEISGQTNDQWATRGRVFRELRFQVVLLLEHVRRLNWIAVDAERGFRDPEEAVREMDLIEAEIRSIITDVRAAAGRPTAHPETTLMREPETVA